MFVVLYPMDYHLNSEVVNSTVFPNILYKKNTEKARLFGGNITCVKMKLLAQIHFSSVINFIECIIF